MPIVFDGGCNEVEDPTLLNANVLTVAQGAEYRKGKRGVFVAKGRQLRGNGSGTTWRGMYYAGFEGGPENQFLIGHSGDTLYGDVIREGMALTTFKTLSAGTLPVVGAHYADRHYLAMGTENLCVENIAGLSQRTMGMAQTQLVIGVSVTQGSGSITTTTGLTYWITEYDSVRGLESVAGNTASTGIFTALDSVIVSVSGYHANSNTDRLRLYRSTDGGSYPEGGLIAEVAKTSTTITDTDSVVSSFPTPSYGFITVGGLDFERDVKPDGLRHISGPFNNSMLGVFSSNPREVAFSAEGRPESWPDVYRVPIQTHRQDVIMCMVELDSMYGVFTVDTIHRLTRLPREIDTAFAGGEATTLVTDERGAVSRKAAVTFTMPGRGRLCMVACRDGIWVTNLVSFMVPVTDGVDWETRVDATKLDELELVNNSTDRRVICYYRKQNSSHGVMYFDYQTDTIRVTHPDHGAIRTATEAPYKGFLRVFTGDARASNGQVYTEGIQDKDDSNYTTSSGQISFRIKSAEIFPAGVHEARRLGRATWMHDAGPSRVEQLLLVNRETIAGHRDLDFSTRQATEGGFEKEANSFSVELKSTGTKSYGVHWWEVEGFESVKLSGQGA